MSEEDEALPLPDEPVPGREAAAQEPEKDGQAAATEPDPPLPDEPEPEPEPGETTDKATTVPSAWSEDGMVAAIWDDGAQAYYFWDRRTGKTSWTNPKEDEERINSAYTYSASFNARTGKFQANASLGDRDRYTEAGRMRRAEEEFYDVEKSAEYNQGKSLREERRRQKFSKDQMNQFKALSKERRNQKRRAWLVKASDDEQPWRKRR